MSDQLGETQDHSQGFIKVVTWDSSFFSQEGLLHVELVLTAAIPATDEPLGKEEEIVCQTRLGGVLKHYERLAA